jgi:four helix bundle protein
MAEKIEDLKLWQRAMELWEAINAILNRPGLKEDYRLRSQLSDAADSVLSNLAEGFEQPTDRAFARYVYDAKTSNAEVRTRLLLVHKRGYITLAEWDDRRKLSEEVARIATGLIKYLRKSDRKNRGLGARAL